MSFDFFWVCLLNCCNNCGKMSAQILRFVAALIVVFTLISTISAGRLSEVGQHKGFNKRWGESLKNKRQEARDAKPKPAPIVERAAATATAA